MPVDEDVILAKIDGMREVIDTRFNSIEREQDGIRKWLERMTTTLETYANLSANLLAHDERIKNLERQASEQVQVTTSTVARVTTLETAHASSGVKLAAIVATVAMVVTGAVAAFFDKIIN